MSNDFSPIAPTESEGSMFAPIPSWERGKKRRSFGARTARLAPETRSFGAETAAAESFASAPLVAKTDPVLTRPAYETRTDAVDPVDDTFAPTPAYATSTARRNNGAAPIAITAGIILLGGLAAAGWYAYQPHTTGVAELTPGSPATTTTTTQVASTAPAAGDPKVLAQADPAVAEPAPAPRQSVTTTTKTRAPAVSARHTAVARARPAAESGADASATAPVAPLRLQVPPAAASVLAPPAAAAAPQVLTPVTPQTTAPAEAPATTAPPPTETPPN